ncbi:MaoC family dehydratase [Ornithinimicrobium sp. Y1847]|uniref:MaoC family dehydratase n=1 Tax=unclassified Ornithinimicrobium TaxID=2615080 RepID=UPI003B67C346
MSDVDIRLHASPPGITGNFAKAVASGRGRPGATGDLPATRVMLTGVEQDVRRLADYCEVTGSTLADTLPATWLHVLTFPLQVDLMAGKDFPFPMLGMVHVANTMTQHRPVRVEEKLTLSSWSDNLSPHRKGHTVDLVGEASVGDEVVWEGRSTYLVRGRGSDDAPARDEQHPVADVELATWRLPADLGRHYAKVSGDANPIHLTGLSAKAFGFPRAIAHGMWTHAKVLSALQARLPEAFTVDVQFVKPILLPSTVVLRGTMPSAGGPAESAVGELRAAGEAAESALAVTSRDASRLHLNAQVRGL